MVEVNCTSFARVKTSCARRGYNRAHIEQTLLLLAVKFTDVPDHGVKMSE